MNILQNNQNWSTWAFLSVLLVVHYFHYSNGQGDFDYRESFAGPSGPLLMSFPKDVKPGNLLEYNFDKTNQYV